MTPMDRLAIYEQRIRDLYPDLQAQSVRFNDDGQNNDVLIINEEIVFRFPKYASAIQQMEIETAIVHESMVSYDTAHTSVFYALSEPV